MKRCTSGCSTTWNLIRSTRSMVSGSRCRSLGELGEERVDRLAQRMLGVGLTAHAKFCTSRKTRSAMRSSTNRGDQLGARWETTRSTVSWLLRHPVVGAVADQVDERWWPPSASTPSSRCPAAARPGVPAACARDLVDHLLHVVVAQHGDDAAGGGSRARR